MSYARLHGELDAWDATLVPEQRTCRPVGGFMNGYYTVRQNIFFNDETSLWLPFTCVSETFHHHINEKMALQVEAIDLTKNK